MRTKNHEIKHTSRPYGGVHILRLTAEEIKRAQRVEKQQSQLRSNKKKTPRRTPSHQPITIHSVCLRVMEWFITLTGSTFTFSAGAGYLIYSQAELHTQPQAQIVQAVPVSTVTRSPHSNVIPHTSCHQHGTVGPQLVAYFGQTFAFAEPLRTTVYHRRFHTIFLAKSTRAQWQS